MEPLPLAASVTTCREPTTLAIEKLDVLRETSRVGPLGAQEYGLDPRLAESTIFLTQEKLKKWMEAWSLQDGEDREQSLRGSWGDAVYQNVKDGFVSAAHLAKQFKDALITDDALLQPPKKRHLWTKKTPAALHEKRVAFMSQIERFDKQVDGAILLTKGYQSLYPCVDAFSPAAP